MVERDFARTGNFVRRTNKSIDAIIDDLVVLKRSGPQDIQGPAFMAACGAMMSHSPSSLADLLWDRDDDCTPTVVDGDFTPTLVDGDYTPTVVDGGDHTPTTEIDIMETEIDPSDESDVMETEIDPSDESAAMELALFDCPEPQPVARPVEEMSQPVARPVEDMLAAPPLIDLTDDDPFYRLGSHMPPMEGDIHVRRSYPPPTAPFSVPDVLSRMPATRCFADEMLAFREAAAAQFTRESDVVWKHMLSVSGDLWRHDVSACGDNLTIVLNYCKDKINSQLMRHPLNFYIGITHCPLLRWGNEEYGHVYDARWGFQCMWVLLKATPDQTRAIEISLSDDIFAHHCRKLNAEKTPQGALVPDQHGDHYLYVCWASD